MAQVAHDATRSKTVPHNDQKVITEPRCDHTGTDPRRLTIYSLTGRTATPCSTKATSSSTHTHTPVYQPFVRDYPGGPVKVKPIWILLKQETASGSGISWAICKSAPRSRQITTPAPHHSGFYRPDALPAAQPTVSKHINVQCIFSRPTALQLLAQMKKKRWRKRAQRVDESVE